ncbi:VUT family protein [Nonomuraea africana]|uniref:VUT family protein n=1 Tax=Nonomuraea africana TaxID=46171 RepID=UPI0033FFE5CD
MVALANLLSASLTVPVGFGLVAPAGVYLAGLLFALRDLIHEQSGPLPVLYALFGGIILSGLLGSDQIAAASAAAFTAAELIDTAVYACTRRHGPLVAVTVSNLVALAVDSTLFLLIAFGSLAMAPGQFVGKVWMTVLAVLLLWTCRRWTR